MAGGLGTRLRPLTDTIPKPAIEIGGKPIIRHILDLLENVGFDNILIKSFYLTDRLRDAIGHDKYVQLIIEKKLTGTAQFLKNHKDKLEECFIVMNGDTLTNLNLYDIIEFHLINKNIATVFTKDNAVHCGGTYIFDKEVIDYIKKEQNIPDLMQTLVNQNIPINLYFSDAYYFDIADKKRLEKARKFYAKSIA